MKIAWCSEPRVILAAVLRGRKKFSYSVIRINPDVNWGIKLLLSVQLGLEVTCAISEMFIGCVLRPVAI